LRRRVVDERRRLDAMEGERVERVRDDLADGAGGEAAAVPGAVDPVADDAARRAVPEDPEEIDRAGDRVAVEDREGIRPICGLPQEPLPLAAGGEELRWSRRLER